MKLLAATIASLALIASASVVAQELDIKRNGSRPSGKGPAEYFTGTVRIDPLFAAHGPARACGGAASPSSPAPAPPGTPIRSARP